MALRDVVIEATFADMNGDELLQVWLKEGSGEWVMDHTVAAGVGPTQEFEFLSLTEGTDYTLQIRALRDGRARVGYLSSDPDAWPSSSRLVFIPGSVEAAAPTITAADWSRTAFASQKVAVTVTPNPAHTDLDIQLLRNGVVVATVAAPHAGPVVLDDLNPPLAADHTYTARHIQLTLFGTSSAPVVAWTGPAAPTGLAEVTGFDTFYQYWLEWDAPNVGAVTRIQDDYLCMATWEDRGVTAADATSRNVTGLTKNSDHESNGNVTEEIFVRARHEEIAFGVTDVSKWVELGVMSPVSIEIANDETAYHACL